MDPATISALIGGGSALGSFAGNILGSTLSFRRQKQLMEHQARLNYDYGALTAQNSPTWNRYGLEQAGYNPMLAVQNSTSGVNSNFAAQSTSQEPDYGSSIGSAVANATDVARLKNETNTTESTVEMNTATARRQNAEASNLEAENPYIGRKQEAEIGKIGAETTKLGAETDHFKAMIENMKARLDLDQYLGEMGIATQKRGQDISYNASKYASNIAKYGYDVNAETQRGIRTDKLPFGFSSTYYDMRGNDKRMRTNDINDRKYWRNYY